MSDKLSLETRTSTDYIQGRLLELAKEHMDCPAHRSCNLADELRELVLEWEQAEVELKAQKAAVHAEIERGLSKYDLGKGSK